jgi:hypothetical protein
MVLAAVCSLAYVSSAQFKNEYSDNDYSMGEVGDAGFSFAWVNYDDYPDLECRHFKQCSFIHVQRAVGCATDIKIVVDYLDATDSLLFREIVSIGSRDTIDLPLTEIGTNREDRFETGAIENIYCVGELASGESSL